MMMLDRLLVGEAQQIPFSMSLKVFTPSRLLFRILTV